MKGGRANEGKMGSEEEGGKMRKKMEDEMEGWNRGRNKETRKGERRKGVVLMRDVWCVGEQTLMFPTMV